jgi:Tfp pilus assembly protein PilZ
MAELTPASPQQPPKQGSSTTNPKLSRQDLRKYLRFKIDDASAGLYVKGFLTSIGLGRANKARAAINLSEGGVMLLTRERIAIGTKVTIRIEMEKFSDVIETTGLVRWCEQSAKSNKDYYAGIQFDKLEESDLKKISQMREWFTSPEYKTRTATRRRLQGPSIEIIS